MKYLLFCLPALMASQARAQTPTYGVYKLQNQVSHKFLQVAGDTLWNQKFADGARIEQADSVAPKTNNTSQNWHLIYQSTTGTTRYYQVRNVFSGKLLTSRSNTFQDTLVQLAESPALVNHQLWSLRKADGASGGANYVLVNKGNSLAATNRAASLLAGGVITQERTRSNFPRQFWALLPQAEQAYRDDATTRFWERNNKRQGTMAEDGGASVPLSDGRVLWMTSDAFDGQSLVSDNTHLVKEGHYISYRNSVLVQPSVTNWTNNAPNLTVPAGQWGARQVFNAPESAYPFFARFAWPYAAIEIGSHVYAWCGEGPLSTMKVVGADGTTKTVRDTAKIRQLGQTSQAIYDLTEQADTTWDAADRFVPNGFDLSSKPCDYNAGMVKADDGYVYVYGAKYNYGDGIYVARFWPDADSIRASWQYWSGNAWLKKPTKDWSAIIAKGVSSSTICRVGDVYVLVTQDVTMGCGPGNRYIFTATSASPMGPFTRVKRVAAIKEYMYGQRAEVYAVHVHPAATNGRNELLITYSVGPHGQGSPCYVAPPAGLMEPYFYRLKGVRIPYSLIGLATSY